MAKAASVAAVSFAAGAFIAALWGRHRASKASATAAAAAASERYGFAVATRREKARGIAAHVDLTVLTQWESCRCDSTLASKAPSAVFSLHGKHAGTGVFRLRGLDRRCRMALLRRPIFHFAFLECASLPACRGAVAASDHRWCVRHRPVHGGAVRQARRHGTHH